MRPSTVAPADDQSANFCAASLSCPWEAIVRGEMETRLGNGNGNDIKVDRV